MWLTYYTSDRWSAVFIGPISALVTSFWPKRCCDPTTKIRNRIIELVTWAWDVGALADGWWWYMFSFDFFEAFMSRTVYVDNSLVPPWRAVHSCFSGRQTQPIICKATHYQEESGGRIYMCDMASPHASIPRSGVIISLKAQKNEDYEPKFNTDQLVVVPRRYNYCNNECTTFRWL